MTTLATTHGVALAIDDIIVSVVVSLLHARIISDISTLVPHDGSKIR
jgi:hypothetical protein